QAVAVKDLMAWLHSESFQLPLALRLRRLGVSRSTVDGLLENAQADGGWQKWAALDATARMVNDLVSSGAIREGVEAANLVTAITAAESAEQDIPAAYWSLQPAPGDQPAGGESEQVLMRGAVLIIVHGRLVEDPGQTADRFVRLSADLQMALA